MDEEPRPYLTFYYDHFKFEFDRDGIYITDRLYKRKYKASVTHKREFPFSFLMLEKQ